MGGGGCRWWFPSRNFLRIFTLQEKGEICRIIYNVHCTLYIILWSRSCRSPPYKFSRIRIQIIFAVFGFGSICCSVKNIVINCAIVYEDFLNLRFFSSFNMFIFNRFILVSHLLKDFVIVIFCVFV